MQDNNYVVFEIIGVKHDGFVNSFVFSQDAVCEISNDKFIIAIQEIIKEYQRQKTNQRSRKGGSARKPQQYHAEAEVII